MSVLLVGVENQERWRLLVEEYITKISKLWNNFSLNRPHWADSVIELPFQFCWHFSFGDISNLVTFQFLWHFSFGDILILLIFLLSPFYFLLSILYCLWSTVYYLMSTVYWLARFWSYLDCLPIPRAMPGIFDIPNQGVQPNEQTTNNTPNIEPIQNFGNQ